MSDTTMILAYVGTIMGVSSTLLGIVNHRRIRSNCCGVKTEVSLDVEATTPPERQLTIKTPAPVDASPPGNTNVPKVHFNLSEDATLPK
jgi:hypothetical protein